MINEPLPNLFGLLVILFPELFQVNLFQMVAGLCGTQVILPGTGKELIQIVVQVAVDQHIPLVLIEPDPIATAAAVNIKFSIGEDLVACHDMAAVRTKFQLPDFPGGINFDRTFLGRKFTSQRPAPGEIDVGGNGNALAIGTLPSGKS